MKKQDLIDKLLNALEDADCLDINNFPSRAAAFGECASVIENILDDYIIIRGEIIE